MAVIHLMKFVLPFFVSSMVLAGTVKPDKLIINALLKSNQEINVEKFDFLK